jgi:hypothetical protein
MKAEQKYSTCIDEHLLKAIGDAAKEVEEAKLDLNSPETRAAYFEAESQLDDAVRNLRLYFRANQKL